MNPLDYVLQRMKELEPRYTELARKDTLDGDEKTGERAEYNRVASEWADLDERRKDLEERQQRAVAAGSINFNVVHTTNPFQVELAPANTGSRSQVIGAGKAAIDAMERRFLNSDQGDELTRIVSRGDKVGETAARLAVTTGSDEYSEQYWRYMTGQSADIRILERANNEYRAMTAGTGSTGGYMVPLYMDPSFAVTGAGAYNPIREVANVKQITTLTYNGSNAAQITAAILAENTAFTDNAPTVAQIQIPTYKYGAYVPASFEAFEDIDTLAADVAQLMADAKYNLEATQFETGSGSAPEGVVTGVTAVTTSRTSPTTGGLFAVADLYKVHAALPARYRRKTGAASSRAWMMSVTVIDTVRQFATANNYHAFLTDLANGQPPQLLGDQLLEASTMSASLTTGQNIVLFGDFNQYYIIDRVGMSTEFIPNVFDTSGLPTGSRAWLMHWRFGAKVADPAGFQVLKL